MFASKESLAALLCTVPLLMVGCGSSSSSSSYTSTYPKAADKYEGSSGDNTLETASSIVADDSLQSRTIFPQGDEDWISVSLTTGTEYELFTTNLNEAGDTYLYLYDENGTQLSTSDDYLDYDSNIQYTAAYSGTYYLKVRSYSADEQTSYRLGVRTFVDSDADGYSTFYDCNDGNDTIYPFADEIAGDGIDQDCSGVDAPLETAVDRYEDDDDIANAKSLYETQGSIEEIIYRTALYRTSHTIDAALEQDFFKFTLPAHSAAYVIDYSYYTSVNSDILATILDENGTEIDSESGSPYLTVENTSSVSKVFYARFEADDGVSTFWYAPALVRIGVDNDGDGYYTQDWESDCNDNDPLINPGVSDALGDGIDSDCDGQDD